MRRFDPRRFVLTRAKHPQAAPDALLQLDPVRGYEGVRAAQVEIGEYTINHTIDYILEGIYKAKPDVLCFSCKMAQSLSTLAGTFW